MNDKPRIFISYAREDSRHAVRLRHLLLDAGYEPRLDIEILTPGTEWVESLRREIAMADFFLFCLTPEAISKNGVQFQELKLAQQIWEGERGDRKLYIIPVHLVECDPVEGLQGLQFVKLYESDGEAKLLNALREEAERWRKRRDAWESHRREAGSAVVNPASMVIELAVNSAPLPIEWVHILHVNTGAMKEPDRFPKNVEAIHQWTWRQSAHVRWRNVELEELDTELAAANLIVLDWSTNYLDKAESAFKAIRTRQSDLPMLILISDSNSDQYPNRRDLISMDSADGSPARSIVISEREWNDDAGIDSVFQRLSVSLTPYQLSLSWEERNLAVKEVITEVN